MSACCQHVANGASVGAASEHKSLLCRAPASTGQLMQNQPARIGAAVRATAAGAARQPFMGAADAPSRPTRLLDRKGAGGTPLEMSCKGDRGRKMGFNARLDGLAATCPNFLRPPSHFYIFSKSRRSSCELG
jgi:hypothetical protein